MHGVGTAGPTGIRAGIGPTPSLGAATGASSGPAPMSDAERMAWAVLAAVERLGPIGMAALLRRYGSAEAILADAARPGAVARLLATPAADIRDTRAHRDLPIDEPVARRIVDAVQRGPALVARLMALGIVVVTLEEPVFPQRLADILMPPHVLFVRGSVAALGRRRSVAVVGTRHPSGHGRAIAGRLARALVAADATVVSGLAFGIDGAAHEATVRAGGVTIAVIGGGHARVGPRAHDRLADAICAADGAIVSEYGPDVEPTAGTFPRRNRIISGLADASIIVEAPARSGALITASWAMEQDREVFVVPGPLDAPASEGCLSLLREFGGVARIVSGVPQLIADLGFVDEAVAKRRPAPPSAVAAATFQAMGVTERIVAGEVLAGRRSVDEIVATTGLPVATVLAALTLLERRGAVIGRHGRFHPDPSLMGESTRPAVR